MTKRGVVLFGLMGIIWGIPYLMIKIAVDGVSVPVLVFARTAIGAAILLPLALRREYVPVLRQHWRPLVAFAAIEIIIPWWLLSDAEHHLTSSMTGLLIAASPVIAVVLSRLTSNERPSAVRWAGLAAGFAGVAVLAGPELRGGNPWAIGEVLLTALCYAVAPLIAARKLTEVPALPMTAVCLGLAALVYTGPAAMTWPSALPAAKVLVALAGLAIVCTALAFVVFFALIREVGTTRALVFTYVNPAVAVAAGVLVLGEPLTRTILLSFGLILGGSVLATVRGRAGRAADPRVGVDAPPVVSRPLHPTA
jgi:drug/metabolite transporter (DMT)-like permease